MYKVVDENQQDRITEYVCIMTEHIVKILECSYINHDVKRFIVEKPPGFSFIPGQATDVSINLPEWKDQLRPFTFTSLNKWPYLEFIIKIYDDHNGVTHQLGKTNAGAELILHDVFGTIVYKEPGIFIAGGAGITPFIAIFRALHKMKKLLPGNALIFSNKTADDIIGRSSPKCWARFYQRFYPAGCNWFPRKKNRPEFPY